MSTSITLEGFYRKAGKLIPWFMSAALVLFIVGVYLGFFVCPIEARQGNSYRIIFCLYTHLTLPTIYSV